MTMTVSLIPRTAIAASVLLALLASVGPSLDAQPGPRDEFFRSQDRKSFSADVLTYPGDSAGMSRVDLYLEIPYSSLQFVNQGGYFRATYELIAAIKDTTDRLITEKVWSGRVEVDSIQEVRIRRPGEVVQKSFHLAPGKYVFQVRVRDIETDRESSSRLRITVPDYGPGRWKVSDAMLLKGVEAVDGRRVITPNVAATISDAIDSFFVFLKLYNDIGADSGLVFTEVIERGGARSAKDSGLVPLKPGENTLLPSVICSTLAVGEYTLRVRAIPVPADSEGGRDLAQTERTFTMRWMASPIEVADIDAAIDQMQYILEKEDLDELRGFPADRKRDRWADFWKRKDPSPGTERNELMEEYYSRVAYANKHFGHYTVGWKTDMGMVHIIFGAPGNIERHPFEIDSKPYEIWTYYELNRQFIFVDATGFGDYRLQTPIWDVYQTRPR